MIDRFFPRDTHYQTNKIFLQTLPNPEAGLSIGDAVLLREAEQYAVAAIITWNTKDFRQRTALPVFTPESYLSNSIS